MKGKPVKYKPKAPVILHLEVLEAIEHHMEEMLTIRWLEVPEKGRHDWDWFRDEWYPRLKRMGQEI